jgi:hypothetical protein
MGRGLIIILVTTQALPILKLMIGVEPTTCCLQDSRSAKLSYTSMLVAEPGVEPGKSRLMRPLGAP